MHLNRSTDDLPGQLILVLSCPSSASLRLCVKIPLMHIYAAV